jgi:4-hydroxymandelate oxidase
MTSSIIRATSRRRFLQFLAGSPLFASGAISAYATETPSKLPDPMIWAPATDDLIKSPKDAINVRFRASGAQERAARAFRLYGVGHRR